MLHFFGVRVMVENELILPKSVGMQVKLELARSAIWRDLEVSTERASGESGPWTVEFRENGI